MKVNIKVKKQNGRGVSAFPEIHFNQTKKEEYLCADLRDYTENSA